MRRLRKRVPDGSGDDMSENLRLFIMYLIPVALVGAVLWFIDGQLELGSLALYVGVVWWLILNEEK